MHLARLLLTFGLFGIILLQPTVASGSAFAFADDAFRITWNRTDLPVADGVVGGTWIWGPDPLTEGLQEQYAESPNGERLVQYFDKSRMEITHPGQDDPSSPWYVTNGLLATELITGQMQVGNDEFIPHFPSELPVAGDPIPQNGPSYATFSSHLGPATSRVGEVIVQRIDWEGVISDDPTLAEQATQLAVFDDATGHNIATPFWTFMTSNRTVFDDGQYVDAALFENPYYATGRPITEAYWADVVVAGTSQLVLVQCFERRCLTFAPANPDGWRVEAANIGRHYHAWRYGQSTLSGTLLFTRDGDLFTVNADGSELRNLTTSLDQVAIQPQWSPDGTRIAFVAAPDVNATTGSVFIMNADGTLIQQVTEGTVNAAPAWSPDGSQIAFERWLSGDPSQRFDVESQIFIVGADGSNEHQLTTIPPEEDFSISQSPAWSPDGERIAFSNINGAPGLIPSDSTIYVVHADGSGLTALPTQRAMENLDGLRVGQRLSSSNSVVVVMISKDRCSGSSTLMEPGAPSLLEVSKLIPALRTGHRLATVSRSAKTRGTQVNRQASSS